MGSRDRLLSASENSGENGSRPELDQSTLKIYIYIIITKHSISPVSSSETQNGLLPDVTLYHVSVPVILPIVPSKQAPVTPATWAPTPNPTRWNRSGEEPWSS